MLQHIARVTITCQKNAPIPPKLPSMNYCRIYPCLLVRQVDQFGRLELPPGQVGMAPCRLVRQEPKFAGLKMAMMDNPAYAFVQNPPLARETCLTKNVRSTLRVGLKMAAAADLRGPPRRGFCVLAEPVPRVARRSFHSRRSTLG